jgi:phosphoglucomutase
VAEFSSPHYLNNWIQSLFNSLPKNELVGSHLVLGGDGRYWNAEAIQIILSMCAATGVGKVYVGQNGILSTPAVSALIRRRKLYGGIILTASHNPGGPDADFGIKYNTSNGGPAPESITDAIFGFTESISSYATVHLPHIDLSRIGEQTFHVKHEHGETPFVVCVIDSVDDYLQTLKDVFDFDGLRAFIGRKDFKLLFDAMHGVTGPYATRILVDELGAAPDSVVHNTPLPDFGGGHPDPNLTYAPELVEKVLVDKNSHYDFGAASDGDGDRNMIIGRNFFVTPSDSLAVIAEYAQRAIPYFANGLRAVARSMPTSAACDHVGRSIGAALYEVPTGWKFFGNIMDHFEKEGGRAVICGEESFGTGSDHVREKDGIWAVLAWLSILAYKNRDTKEGELISVAAIVQDFWKRNGRNFYCRYDYEGVDSGDAAKLMKHLESIQSDLTPEGFLQTAVRRHGYEVSAADSFNYLDPFDGSVSRNQGLRFLFTDGSRVVFRLSGTGSVGATIRMYLEQYQSDQNKIGGLGPDGLAALVNCALEFAKIQEFTGRERPTVIT